MPARRRFLLEMLMEAMKAYEVPGEEWSQDERELLPRFLSRLPGEARVLDLAGGYGRIAQKLLRHGHRVVLLDLSPHSLKRAKEELGSDPLLDVAQADMLHLPLRSCSFEGVWMSQAFEYVPPELRRCLLVEVARILRKRGIFFLNIAHVGGECGLPRYLLNFLYWRVARRKPVRLGDYVYRLELAHYRGWHYHSLVFSRRGAEKLLEERFRIIERKTSRKEYLAYILQKGNNSGLNRALVRGH